MDLTIHTYGHIDAMYYVLNGIAMLTNHGFTEMLITTVSLATACYYAAMAAYAGPSGRQREYLVKVFAMILMINGALMPKTEMYIVDHVSKKIEKVDNLPYGFAVPVGILESLGDLMTGGFEQAFTAVGSANYRDCGMVFGARLVQESRSWRIRTPEFVENMDTFLRRCVIRDAMIGYNYTASDLLSSKDIWQLASSKAGTMRKVSMRRDKSWELVNCKEAAFNYIAPAFGSEIEALKQRKANTDFANATTAEKLSPRTSKIINNMLGKNIELAFSSYLGTNQSAESLIKQQMMINSMSNIGDDYGYARASMQQESSWRIAGDLASTYLPILLSVIKGMLYAAFMFMIPLMLLSGGGKKYMSYLTVVASLQLWPALNSILNMFIDIYSSDSLSGIASGIVSFTTYSEVGNYADKIVAVASGLEMSIPFLAFAIVQGGVGGFIHLAGNITGATQSAATSVAGEVTTGNRSLDNISLGNMQMAMQQGFKTDWNQSYQEGATQIQGASGEMQRTFADGSTAINSGSNMNLSSGSRTFNLGSSQEASLQQILGNTLSSLQSDERNYNESKSSIVSRVGDLISNIAQRESAGETFNYDQMGEQGNALQQAVNHVKSLHDNDGYGWGQAGAVTATLYADGKIVTPKVIPLVEASAGMKVDASVEARNTSQQSLDKQEGINTSNDTNKSFNNLVKAATNKSWLGDNSLDNSFAESTKASYDNMQQYQQSIAQKREQAATYSDAIQYNRSNGAHQQRDMYHEVEHGLMKQYGVSQHAAHQMIESNDPRVEKVWDGIVRQNIGSTINQVRGGRDHIDNKSFQEGALFHNEYSKKVDDQPLEDLRQEAADKGLSKEQTQQRLQETKNDLETAVGSVTKENDTRYEAVRFKNQELEFGMQNRADQHEKDSIGQGKMAFALAALAKVPTLGNSGTLDIGGPNSEERSRQNMERAINFFPPTKADEGNKNDK